MTNAHSIAIVYPSPNFDSVPSLCNTAELLAGAGYQVDVFMRTSSSSPLPSFKEKAVRVIGYPSVWDLGRVRRRVVHPLMLRLLTICAYVRHTRAPYRCVVGVDPRGLVEAATIASTLRRPLVYYSLELLLSAEIREAWRAKLKRQEIDLSQRAAFVIIQDTDRARLLSKDNGLALDRFALVPNAPLGPARRAPERHWHRRFGLPSDARVALYAGSLSPWACLDEIVGSVSSWPDPWVLVVHSHRTDRLSREAATRLQEAAPSGRVFFSLGPVPRERFDLLVDSADVGIAFYRPVPGGNVFHGANIETIGLSSGKVACYLRAGLPVIVNSGTELGPLLEERGCGVAVPDGRGIGPALRRVVAAYDEYSRKAMAFFEEALDFRRAFGCVLERIRQLQ